MEKAAKVGVVRAVFDWNDIGSWLAASTLIEPDGNGNRVSGETALVDVKDTFVLAGNRLVAAVGVKDLLIVETPDALLVAHRDRAQDVKQVVSHLESIDHPASYHHQTTHRPWGSFTVLEEGNGFKIKRLVVKPGKSLSLQMHHHRSEHWVVVAGEAEIVNGEQTLRVKANESTYIPGRPQAPVGQPRQRNADRDRGADRQLSRRGRHRPLRGRLRPGLIASPNSKTSERGQAAPAFFHSAH